MMTIDCDGCVKVIMTIDCDDGNHDENQDDNLSWYSDAKKVCKYDCAVDEKSFDMAVPDDRDLWWQLISKCVTLSEKEWLETFITPSSLPGKDRN